MCGRYTLRHSRAEIARAFELLELPDFTPRYNIAPTQGIAVVRAAPPAEPSTATSPVESPRRQLAFLHWGLIPSWADDPAIANRLINARAESIDTKPAFRTAFRQRRCLIVADGFFEWQKQGRRKQPFYLRVRDGELFGMAGVWESWQRGTQTIESCAIITTTANALVSEVHDRMPVIVQPADYQQWLDPAIQQSDLLKPLLRPYPAEHMQAAPVSPQVNSPKYDGPKCVQPYRPERPLELFPDDL
jgi:putative SOS response-associated peptidase YedK